MMIITDSHINATGGHSRGAGIGMEPKSTAGLLAIVNAHIFALGAGPGIGSIESDSAVHGIHDLVIDQSIVTAFGGSGSPGIGSGSANSFDSTIDNLTISNSVISAISESDAPAIGSGYASGATSSVKSIHILHSTVECHGGIHGSGLGSGRASRGSSLVLEIQIWNSSIISFGGVDSPGIGSGISEAGISCVENLTITHSQIFASGQGSAVGIGASDGSSETFVIDSIAIYDSRIEAIGGPRMPSIGARSNTEGIGQILLGERIELICESEFDFAIHVMDITLSNAIITATTSAVCLFTATPKITGSLDVSIFYLHTRTTLEPSLVGFRYFLQFGYLELPDRVWELCLTNSSMQKCRQVNGSRVMSGLLSAPDRGTYEILASSPPFAGVLTTPANQRYFNLTSNWVYVDWVSLSQFASLSPMATPSLTPIASTSQTPTITQTLTISQASTITEAPTVSRTPTITQNPTITQTHSHTPILNH
jgi:hypothetical protein